MNLSFKPQFVEPILNGTKIHTIRDDKPNLWHAGMSIQMATGVRTKNYNCFKEVECKSIQAIEIKYTEYICNGKPTMGMNIFIDNRMLSGAEMVAFARNDGFYSTADFYQLFKKGFSGKIIHWTDKKY